MLAAVSSCFFGITCHRRDVRRPAIGHATKSRSTGRRERGVGNPACGSFTGSWLCRSVPNQYPSRNRSGRVARRNVSWAQMSCDAPVRPGRDERPLETDRRRLSNRKSASGVSGGASTRSRSSNGVAQMCPMGLSVSCAARRSTGRTFSVMSASVIRPACAPTFIAAITLLRRS